VLSLSRRCGLRTMRPAHLAANDSRATAGLASTHWAITEVL
jgi:hypothetical protein